MESELVTQTLQFVEILYCSNSSAEEKNEANSFLQELRASKNSYQIAIVILQSKNPGKYFLQFFTK